MRCLVYYVGGPLHGALSPAPTGAVGHSVYIDGDDHHYYRYEFKMHPAFVDDTPFMIHDSIPESERFERATAVYKAWGGERR